MKQMIVKIVLDYIG